MTRKEWEQLAEDREAKAQEAFEADDEIAYELYAAKAQTARYNAAYGTEEEREQP